MRKKLIIAILAIIGLSACSVATIAPAEQLRKQIVEKPQTDKKASRTVVKKQSIAEYHCDKSQIVSVQSPPNHKKNSTITLTFNQSSYKLSPNVAKLGRKYSNIRWIWTVDNNGTGTLIDNRNKVLAKNCVKR